MNLGINYLFDRQIQVADEGHRRVCDHLNATGETPVCHEVLHDLDGVLILDLDPPDFIECHSIPVPYQTNLMTLVVVEQRGLGRLATTDQG